MAVQKAENEDSEVARYVLGNIRCSLEGVKWTFTKLGLFLVDRCSVFAQARLFEDRHFLPAGMRAARQTQRHGNVWSLARAG